MHAAAVGARTLPADVDDALLRFTVTPPRGALLLRNAPIGELPPTPPSPEAPVAKDLATELTLLTVARRLGQPVGYVPEHGGRIVQNIVPTQTRRRPADVDLVALEPDVPHRDGVPPAPPPLSPAAVPARRPVGAHDARIGPRHHGPPSRRRGRRDVRAALSDCGRCQLPRRAGQRTRPRSAARHRHPRRADVHLRRRPDRRASTPPPRTSWSPSARRSPRSRRRSSSSPATCSSSTTTSRCTAVRPSAPASTAPTGGSSEHSSSRDLAPSAADRTGRVITTEFGR